ncbi:hypothetical protein K7I13_11740 [Brucepastera parasyntrophica]|uniref:cytochrome b5 domain-containing protein n=1 Tax=Brucepastera parasyntrophica TaxID=2880008 RepID=UPI00210DE23D|nr:cytochrome b5 domain-containing protein [Brucepastera parasyntrophica]ULQ59161.1 hypothetical protein K7I13_11740 [Brucepastera parasyntrophica]
MKTSFRVLVLLLAFTAVAFAGCKEEKKTDPQAAPAQLSQSPGLELTVEQLSQYNGQDGRPAYVAVDGIIYDVTAVPKWAGGKHMGNTAGQDLTEVIKTKSPHGTSVLSKLPVVGKLIQ